MASMGILLKPSSFLVNRGDSNPSLKWRMNPLLRTTQIVSLPSSMMMIKNNSTTASGFIQTIKCSSNSSNSNRGSDYFRVQCVMNNSISKKNCCFKKEEEEEEEEEEENPFKEGFGKVIGKALMTPVVAAILVYVLLTKYYPTLASSSRHAIFFGICICLAYDLYKAITSRRRRNIGDDGRIRFYLGPALGSILIFVCAISSVFGFNTLGTVTWVEGSESKNKIIRYMVQIIANMMSIVVMFMVMLFGFASATITWPPPWSKEGSVNTQKSTKLQAGVIKEMVNSVVDSAFGSNDTKLAGETVARRPEAARAAHEEDPIAKGDDEEERTRRDKTEHDLLK